MSLLTKVQLKDAEPGEFIDSQPRTRQETRDLINRFPWTEQRENIAIGPTNPSVTIEGPDRTFLKLAPYYHDKFVLYYLDKADHLYTLPVPSLQDALPIISSFFDTTAFIPTGFKRQQTPFRNNSVHFKTGNFTYSMHPAGTFLSVCIQALLWLFIPIYVLIKIHNIPSRSAAGTTWILFPFALIMAAAGTLIIALFINHMRRSKNKILILSRGAASFSFGDALAPVIYDKKDISEILLYGGYRGMEKLKRTEIIFADGRTIDISGLLIEPSEAKKKFPHNTCTYINKGFPFMPPEI